MVNKDISLVLPDGLHLYSCATIPFLFLYYFFLDIKPDLILFTHFQFFREHNMVNKDICLVLPDGLYLYSCVTTPFFVSILILS